MRSSRFLPALLLLLAALCPGCGRAQTPQAQGQSQRDLNRRIEVLVRGELNIPGDYKISLGERKKSEFAGYDSLPITFAHNTATRTLDFLISSDNKTLLRMDKMDLSKDPSSVVAVADRPYRGSPAAKVTIVNFDDLECPFCARMHHELFPDTLARYGDKVKIVYKDFPLLELHPWALHAAVDANCLAKQNSDAYWSYVDWAHDHGEDISGPPNARTLSASDDALDKRTFEEGAKHKLNEKELKTCVSAQDTSKIKSEIDEGTLLGIYATPTVYVNGEKISGAEGTDVLWPVIDRALLDAGETPPPPAKDQTTAPASKPQGQ